MMKLFKAKPVVVPNDMAERYDKLTGQEEGFLRNMIADGGNLHDLEEEMLAIGLMSAVKGIMEEKRLPDSDPLSIERLCNVMYVIMFAYCIGTMTIQDDGEVSFGQDLKDVRKAIDVNLSKEIQFANGNIMPVPEFMGLLKEMTTPKYMERIYGKVVKRHGFIRSIEPQDAFSVAKMAIIASKDLIMKKR